MDNHNLINIVNAITEKVPTLFGVKPLVFYSLSSIGDLIVILTWNIEGEYAKKVYKISHKFPIEEILNVNLYSMPDYFIDRCRKQVEELERIEE